MDVLSDRAPVPGFVYFTVKLRYSAGMNIETLLDRIRTEDWKEEEATTSPAILDLFFPIYVTTVEAVGEPLYTCALYQHDDGYCHEWVPLKEVNAGREWLLEQCKDPGFIDNVEQHITAYEHTVQTLFDTTRGNLENTTTEELVKLLREAKRISIGHYGYTILGEVFDPLTKDEYESYFATVPEGERAHAFQIFSTFEEYANHDKEQLSLLSIAANETARETVHTQTWARVQDTNLEAACKEHAARYFWIQNNFQRARVLDAEHFYQALKDELEQHSDMVSTIRAIRCKQARLKAERAALVERWSIPEETQSFYATLRYFSYVQDRRKVMVQQAVAILDAVHIEVARSTSVPRDELYSYYVDDVEKLLTTGSKLADGVIEERRYGTYCSYIDEAGKPALTIFSGKHFQAIHDAFEKKHTTEQMSNVTGFVASKGTNGVVEGVVRVIVDPHKEDVKQGEVLVAGMTRPEFVPHMKKAIAIVTNEGGITSHAAVVSREMKKPCIIGTKVATKVFKTGDQVCVDTDTGVVTKL